MQWSVERNTPQSNTAARSFEVTHCFHPLHGKTLELVDIRNGWSGGEQVYYHDEAGHERSMPIAWTSLVATDPVVAFGEGRSAFRLADLLELARLIGELRAQQQTGQTDKNSAGIDSTGGQDV